MQDELNQHYPSSDVQILAVNEFGEESGNGVAAANTDLPLLQDVDANNDQQSDVWDGWGVTWRDVRVVDSDATLRHVVNLTPAGGENPSLEIPQNYAHLLDEIVAVATEDNVAASDWQNRVEPYDVSGDGFVVPNDVLRVINRINGEGAGDLGSASGEVSNYYDVSGDGFVTSLDALRIIRHLNEFSSSGAGEPAEPVEERAGEVSPEAHAADAVFALAAQQGEEDASDHDVDA